VHAAEYDDRDLVGADVADCAFSSARVQVTIGTDRGRRGYFERASANLGVELRDSRARCRGRDQGGQEGDEGNELAKIALAPRRSAERGAAARGPAAGEELGHSP